MINKIIYILGTSIRSPEIKSKYKELKETEKLSIEELEINQLVQLKQITKYAYENSEFYKNIYDKNNFHPSELNTLKDIERIPYITKSDLLKNISGIQNLTGYRKLFFSETSGSTGEPLVFYRNSEWDASHRAAQLRGYSWYNVKPWEKNGYFWGYNINANKRIKIRILDALVNRFRLFSYNEKEIYKFSEKLKKSSYLEGYSSMIYETAKIVNTNNLGPFNLKMIKGTSEKIYDSYQFEIKKAFGNKMISEYGAAETGIIAFECPKGHMHITMENVIVEEIAGEAIITNLVSKSFPIIRYKLGDSITIDKETKCECGMNHYIIKEVIGRIGKVIYGNENKYPSLTLYYIFKNLVLNYGITLNYQAIQEVKGKLILNIEQNINQYEMECLNKECKLYFDTDIEISYSIGKLKRDYSGKYKDFITLIEES